MAVRKIGIVGTGNIGACEATLVIGNGIPCSVISISAEESERCRKGISANFDELIHNGLATEGNKRAALALLEVTEDYAALADADFVFEAVLERIDIKHSVYQSIEAVVSPETIVASTTSSITVDELSANMQHPERMLVAHPFQPVHMLPLVELVGGSKTTQTALDKAFEVLTLLDRKIVRMKKSIAGFVVNRLAQAMFRESLYMIEQNVVDAEGIDLAIKYAVGMRYASIGLLEYFDDVGFELESAIAETVYPDLCGVSATQEIVRDGLASGKTGRKAGQGLYDWTKRDDADYLVRKSAPYLESFRWKLPG